MLHDSSINGMKNAGTFSSDHPHRPAPLFLTLSNLSSPPWRRKARKGGNQNGNSNGKFLYVLMKGQFTPPMKWIYILCIYIYILYSFRKSALPPQRALQVVPLPRQFTREKTKSSPSPRNHMPNSLWYMWVYVYKSVPKIKPLSHKSGFQKSPVNFCSLPNLKLRGFQVHVYQTKCTD